MATNGGPNIIEDGLIFTVDAANKKSYPGSGTAWNDLSGNANTGTLTNGPAFDSENSGNVNFDGTNDYIILTSAITNSIYTVNFWYKTGGNDGGYGYFTTDAGSPSKGFAMSEGGTAVELSYGNFYYYNASSATKIPNNTLLTTNTWYNIVAVFDTSSNTIKVYINGVLDVTQSISNIQTSVVHIGRWNSGNNHYINGNMASYKIYNRELSAAEVLQNYNATKNRFI